MPAGRNSSSGLQAWLSMTAESSPESPLLLQDECYWLCSAHAKEKGTQFIVHISRCIMFERTNAVWDCLKVGSLMEGSVWRVVCCRYLVEMDTSQDLLLWSVHSVCWIWVLIRCTPTAPPPPPPPITVSSPPPQKKCLLLVHFTMLEIIFWEYVCVCWENRGGGGGGGK